MMSIEESRRYGIDEPEAYFEWGTKDDEGYMRVGPNHRWGSIALTHQKHCLRKFREALSMDSPPAGPTRTHCEHCLSFVRQHILCAADITLEPGDAFARNFTAERVTGDRECMDAEAFYASMWEGNTRWLEFMRDSSV